MLVSLSVAIVLIRWGTREEDIKGGCGGDISKWSKDGMWIGGDGAEGRFRGVVERGGGLGEEDFLGVIVI